MLTPSLFSRHPPSVEHQSVPSVARHPPPSMSAAGPPPPGPPPGGPPGPSPGGLPDHTAARKRPASGEAGADVDPPWPSPVGAGAVGPPSPSLVGVPDHVMPIGGHSGIGVPFWMIDRIIRPAPDLIRPLTLIIDTRTVVQPGLLSQLSNAELGSLIRRAANVMMRGDPINWIPDAGDLDIFLSESSLGWTLVVRPVPTPEHRRSTSASGRLMLEH